jgi:hypothetical protein
MASLKTDFHFEYLALFFLAYIFMYAAFSLRWHMMNERAGSYAASFAATVLASGGNALLPARGGDILRMLYYKQKTGQPVTVSAVRAVLEKGMDLPVFALHRSHYILGFPEGFENPDGASGNACGDSGRSGLHTDEARHSKRCHCET